MRCGENQDGPSAFDSWLACQGSTVVPTAQPNESRAAHRRRVVLTTFGSLGDLHPYVAIALGLQARGHEAVLATGECYRQKIEALGLGFRPLRPDSDFVSDPDVMRRVMDLRWGTVRVIRELVLPALRDSYEDTLAAAEGADLLVSHPLAYATRLVAEKTGTPWASTMITPLGFGSAYDPPMLPGFPALSKRLRFLGPAFWKPLKRFLTWATCSWAKPWYRLRAEIGLPPAEGNPLVDGHSPLLHLALFSKRLADRQPDWPPQTVITGFPLFDGGGRAASWVGPISWTTARRPSCSRSACRRRWSPGHSSSTALPLRSCWVAGRS